VNFYDFTLRAWQFDDNHIQVMVHSSPDGDMPKPVIVECEPAQLNILQRYVESEWSVSGDYDKIIEIGKQLARFILPPSVTELLEGSLKRIPFQDSLRVRLCLDRFLIDRPWEFLYRTDVDDEETLSGFIALNPRISLVRGAPNITNNFQLSADRQHIAFVGATWLDGPKPENEYQHLVAALKPVRDLFDVRFLSASDEQLEVELMKQAEIFYYLGHTDLDDQGAYMIKHSEQTPFQSANRLYSDQISDILVRSRARLAVFAACNSGKWKFVRPFLRSNLPIFVGTQGIVSIKGTAVFCQTLFSLLAVGASFDEAVISARQRLRRLQLIPGTESIPATESRDWGMFMVYMPIADSTVFPRPNEYRFRQRTIHRAILTASEEAEEIRNKQEILEAHKRRLHERELQKAEYGMSTDPSINIEIDEITREIRKVEQQIQELMSY
jgi:CHAT domain